MKNTKHKIVYNMEYALKLKELGHELAGMLPNNKNPKYYVWIFKQDATLEADLMKLIREGRHNER